jgi:hypothetical protein
MHRLMSKLRQLFSPQPASSPPFWPPDQIVEVRDLDTGVTRTMRYDASMNILQVAACTVLDFPTNLRPSVTEPSRPGRA